MSKPRPVEPPDPMAQFLVALRQTADDPDRTEGTLRWMLRRSATLLETQHGLIESQTRNARRLAWHFGALAVMWCLMLGWMVASALLGLFSGGST